MPQLRIKWSVLFNSMGVYTVKSGSKFLAEENLVIPIANNQSQDNGLWKLIWGLSIPNKVSNFLWRSCLNVILAKRNLWRRKMLPDVKCNVGVFRNRVSCTVGVFKALECLGFDSNIFISAVMLFSIV